MGAHYNSLSNPDKNGYKRQLASPDDQFSIRMGVKHAIKNNYSQWKGTGKPLKQNEYTNSKGEKVQVRKDNPKTYPDGGTQGNHYNAGQAGKKLDQHHNY